MGIARKGVGSAKADGAVSRRGRTLFVTGGVDESTFRDLAVEIAGLEARAGAIRIVLHSSGGDEGSGWAIYDLLRRCRRKIVVEGYGEVQSIAALILQAAQRRLLAPNCRFMIHNGTVSVSDIGAEAAAGLARELDSLAGMYYRALAERSGKGVDEIRELCRRDTYLSAEEAVRAGFADGVLPATATPSRVSTS